MKLKKSSYTFLNVNFTRAFFRFLKVNGAFSNFISAIQHGKQGRPLYDTFYALKFDPKGKKELYHDDPLKWIMSRQDVNSWSFLSEIISNHINWGRSNEGHKYWGDLHKKWQQTLCHITEYNGDNSFIMTFNDSFTKKNKGKNLFIRTVNYLWEDGLKATLISGIIAILISGIIAILTGILIVSFGTLC